MYFKMCLFISNKLLIEDLYYCSFCLIMSQVHALLCSVSDIPINCKNFWFNSSFVCLFPFLLMLRYKGLLSSVEL